MRSGVILVSGGSVVATGRKQTMTIPSSRTLLAVILFVIPLAPALTQESAGSAAPATTAQQMPDWYKRGLPSPGHAALEPLVGLWRVHFEIHGSLGRSPDEPPLVSDDILCRREWVAGGRYIEDTTEGMVEGGPYWRRGWLGYSNMDLRYEWVTVDATNSTMMTYVGEPGSGIQRPRRQSASASRCAPKYASTTTTTTPSIYISRRPASPRSWRHAPSIPALENSGVPSHIRPMEKIIDTFLALDDRPLSVARPPERRLVGICRHFMLPAIAIFRHHGVPARGRGGFGAYFNPGQFEDHWVCEYWKANEGRWALLDSQFDDVFSRNLAIGHDVFDVPREQFLTASDAWRRCRTGELDPNLFGIEFSLRWPQRQWLSV